MTTYRLIDTDTRETVGTASSLVGALALTPYLPADCVPEAETWEDVVTVAEQHADGIPGVVEGFDVVAQEVSR